MAELLWIVAHKSLNHIKDAYGGGKIEYLWNVSTPTADVTTAEILFDLTITTPKAKFFSAGIKKFYLNTSLTDLNI